MKKIKFFRLAAVFMSLSFLGATSYAAVSGGEVKQSGNVTILTAPSSNLQSQMASINFSGARAMQMSEPPQMVPEALEISVGAKKAFKGTPGFSSGQSGSGQENPMSIPKMSSIDVSDGISTQEFGTFQHPFTTSRADAKAGRVSKEYPFRASGKLFFNIGTSTFVCSASLIKKGIIVTAAHCVAGYGTGSFYSNWVYVPAQNDRFTPSAPYGIYGVTGAVVMTSWINGTDGCNVVCPNDVAVLVAAPVAGVYPGTRTGFLGYGWDNYGFTSFAGLNATEITQLGYPVGLGNGGAMQRTDSLGYTITDAGWFNNIQIGSRMGGGSSGGPWIINFGIDPSATPDLPGLSAKKNTIVAVTSWGYISTDPKVQGASPFTSGNIVPLVNSVCPSAAC
ncbi:trypsin [Nitrosomonas sp. Nm84]|uniref:trypsin-like serine peptidase n=1 Tax=Nitrosomonas sp. Nm84 TaxID=200124 RepID=UPI000D76902B|nr:trypsin-like serine protease [Nitrosomonas sp. Nm84]PXW81575.1 trypsin [Nitrosomonas sp. Nm84]